MDWSKIPACHRGLPDPLFIIPLGRDWGVPVIVIPEMLLPEPLRGKRIRVYALLGFINPVENIKLIPSSYMLAEALATHRIRPHGTLIEPTSGNMGLALAYCAKEYSITVRTLVSDALPSGKLLPLTRFGAEVVTESQAVNMLGLSKSPGAIKLARLLQDSFGWTFLNQYENAWNPESYEKLVAPPLWRGIRGRASMLVAAAGSTGTLLGLGRYFKSQRRNFTVVATYPYLDQDIPGARDRRRLKEVKHPWEEITDVKEPIDHRVARAMSSDLNMAHISVGPTSGAAFGTAMHLLLNRVEEDRLEELREEDGTIGVIIPFADTEYPYS